MAFANSHLSRKMSGRVWQVPMLIHFLLPKYVLVSLGGPGYKCLGIRTCKDGVRLPSGKRGCCSGLSRLPDRPPRCLAAYRLQPLQVSRRPGADSLGSGPGGGGHTSQPRPLHLLPSLASTGQTVFTADMHRRPCLPQPGPLSGSSKGRTPFTERPWRSRARGEGAVSTVSGAAGRTFASRGPQRAPLPSSSPLGSPRDRGLVQSHPQKELWL